jgi:hypothetical protein
MKKFMPWLLLAPLFIAHSLQAQSGIAPAASIKGDFALQNVHTGKYVRIKDANGANGTPIVAYSPVNWKCVTWALHPTAEGGYTLQNLFSGKTLQPLNGHASAGVALEEQPLRPSGSREGQEYELIAAGNDPAGHTTQYYIRLKGSELYLTPADPGGETNSAIILQALQKSDLQRWVLIGQHPTM